MKAEPISTLIKKAERTEQGLSRKFQSRRELNTELLNAFGYKLNNAGYVWLTNVRSLYGASKTTWSAMEQLTSLSSAVDFHELEQLDARAAKTLLTSVMKSAPPKLSDRSYHLSRLTRAALAARKTPTPGKDGMIYLELTLPKEAWPALKRLLKKYVP